MRTLATCIALIPVAIGCQDADREPDADGDGVPASADCDDTDPAMHTICLKGEQTYTGPFVFSFDIPDLPATCDGEISMVVEYPSDPDSFPALKSSTGWCSGMASEMDNIDLTHRTEFTSFFDVNGGIVSPACDIPWAGELSSDGTTLTGISDEVECDTGSLWGPLVYSYEFSASLQTD